MFGEKKTENNMINIRINNSQICQKDEVKYLGIVIDKNLKWKPHRGDWGNSGQISVFGP